MCVSKICVIETPCFPRQLEIDFHVRPRIDYRRRAFLIVANQIRNGRDAVGDERARK